MIVIVSEDDLTEVSDQGSVVLFVGTSEEGKRVRFGVDHRMAWGLHEAVQAHGEIPAEVEGWQVMGVAP